MKTIVFILNSIQHPRCAKRIDEFLSRGYTVAVYGFSRENGLYIPKTYRMLGMLCNKSSYFSRFKLMYNAIRKVANQFLNAYSPISVTPSGSWMFVSWRQLMNAYFPIFVTFFGS